MYNYKEEIELVTRACDHPGCADKGEHRAPKSRGEKPEYYWFCLEHVRDYNKRWDYFSGMSREEIEGFQKEAVHGHRPTWNHQMRPTQGEMLLHSKLRHFLGEGEHGTHRAPPPIPQKLHKALQALELEHPAGREEIKLRYKTLVKQYHPDVNQGDKLAEERFKHIAVSYQLLIDEYVA